MAFSNADLKTGDIYFRKLLEIVIVKINKKVLKFSKNNKKSIVYLEMLKKN